MTVFARLCPFCGGLISSDEAMHPLRLKIRFAPECGLPGRRLEAAANVRFGSRLCENAKTLNRDKRSYSFKTVLIAQRASGFNLAIELKKYHSSSRFDF
jgi:hypothetical protein